MTTIVIGSGNKWFAQNTFGCCPKLRNVYCYANNIPSTEIDIFLDTPIGNATLHVPAASLDLYNAAEPWIYFKEIVALTDSDPNPSGIVTIELSDDDKAVIYDLNGRRVEQPSKGIYIKNGKKVVVK